MGVGKVLNVNDFIQRAERAIANGVATLDASAKIPKAQISLAATDVGAVGTEVDPTVPALAKTLSTNNAVLAAINAATGTIDGAKIPAQSWSSVTGKPTTLEGFGITDAQPLGNELTAIQALADTTGFLRKTGNGAYSIDTASYLPLTGGTVSGNVNLSSTTPSTSPTTGASVVAGGQGISGDLHVGGFSSFGGVASGHPAIKIKEITGITGATQGSVVSVAHGLTTSKIKSVVAAVDFGGVGESVCNSYLYSAGYQFDWSIVGGNITLNLHPTNSANILSKPFRALIFYTA